jgi:hypothetical protein
MDVLILGGTGFLGRRLDEAALGNGHRVTLFNRGIKAPDLFPEVETIEGDREVDVDCGKAIEAGLTFRPLSETIEDVLDWDRATVAGRELAAGLRPEREQELLRAWHGVTL